MTVEDFLNAKINYRLPYTRDELKFILENETVFKKSQRINIDQFVKHFFPDGSVPDGRSDSASSGDDRSLNRSFGEMDTNTGSRNQKNESPDKKSSTEGDLFSIGGSSLLSGSLKS